MRIVLVAVAAIMVLIGAVSARNSKTEESLPVPSATTIPSPIPTPTFLPTPTSPPTPISLGEISQFRYPGSSLIGSTGTTYLLESSENSDKITNWYKEKIEKMGMNIKTFVETNSNGNILNKLVGRDARHEISVEIKKDADSSVTAITVSLKTATP